MASQQVEVKDSVQVDPNDSAEDSASMDANDDAKDDAKNDAKVDPNENAKDTLLEALLLKNCRKVEAILQKHPELVNFDYQDEEKDYGTPLIITCGGSMNEQCEEEAGTFKKFRRYFHLIQFIT